MLPSFETQHSPGTAIRLHRHGAPYVALVLEGGYQESSIEGAWLCEPGDLILHSAWHLHANRFAERRSRVLNLVLCQNRSSKGSWSSGVWRPRHAREFLADARWDEERIRDLLAESAPRPARSLHTTLARFVVRLGTQPGRSITEAAAGCGISREHAARSFRRHFGFSPRAVRAEARFRAVHALLTDSDLTLADVAFEAGFADQAHMSRCVRAATGLTPGELRRLLAPTAWVTSVQ